MYFLDILNVHHYAVLADCHFPFTDMPAYNLALDIIEDISLRGKLTLILNGDFADVIGFSMHGKNPRVGVSLEDEIESVTYQLEGLRQRFVGAELVYIEGNHEQRAARYLTTNALALYNQVKIENLFRVKESGFDWIPYTSNQAYRIKGTDILVRHCPLSQGVNAETFNLRSGKTLICGHLHRMCHKYGTILTEKGPREIQSILMGSLADFDSPAFDYTHSRPNVKQWSRGFCIVTCLETKQGIKYFIDNIPIQKTELGHICTYQNNVWSTY